MDKGEREKGDENMGMKPPSIDEEGSYLVGKKGGKRGPRTSPRRQGAGEDVIPSKGIANDGRKGAARQAINVSGGWGFHQREEEENNLQPTKEDIKPQYYRQLDNGDFDMGDLDEEVEMEEATPGGQDVERPPDPT